MPRRGRRGYPTAILIGLDVQTANIWLVYSESIKSGKVIQKSTDDKTGYKHNEEIVEAVKVLLSEGFNQLIIASHDKKRLNINLLEYIKKSHKWLTKRLAIKELEGKAITANDVVQLIKTNQIQKSIAEATKETNEKILEELERALNTGAVLFTIQELSDALNREEVPKFILVSEKYDAAWRGNRRYQSIVQVAKNLRTTFTIVKQDTLANARLEQLGGFVCVIRR
jgi:stalled ribosome rescue protein Dom34